MRARLMTMPPAAGKRAATKAGACAAADKGNLVARAKADDGLNLCLRCEARPLLREERGNW